MFGIVWIECESRSKLKLLFIKISRTVFSKMVLQRYFLDVIESLPKNTVFSLPACKETPLEIEFEKEDEVKTVNNIPQTSLPFSNSDVFNTDILSWRRLTAEDKACKAVYEVTFDVQGSNFAFKAGDTIGIIPRNDEVDVSFVLAHLDLEAVADCSYRLCLNTSQKGKLPPHVPVKSSLRHVLEHCVDLRSVLKKLFLLSLSRHTKDENERKILEYFCSKEGSAAYQTHILNRNMCLLDLFAMFKSCKPPIQVLLSNLPRLLPRPYSLVNSGLKEARVLKICFSVMLLENNRKGLTTGWLEKMILKQESDLERTLSKLTITNDCHMKVLSNLTITNDCDMKVPKIPIYLRKNLSGFSLPGCVENPLILIGCGTGVAPFIGFMEERELCKDKNPDIKQGEVWLFFGCRNPELDFIYEKELNEFVEKGVLKKLCTAFSRVDGNVKYIQDALKQNAEEITKLIETKASIYVCGDLKNMASQVQDTLIQCLVTAGKTINGANEVISNLQKEKKYVVDAWS